jgi:hypothetical protein
MKMVLVCALRLVLMSLRREHRQLQLLKEQIIQINLQLKVQLEIGLFPKRRRRRRRAMFNTLIESFI